MDKLNNIYIHQAFYGNANKSHGCLKTTLDDGDLKSFLTAFTDRPSSLQPGLGLTPYLSASRYGQYYIFTKTFPDVKATRGGMVFTHVLIIKLEDISSIDNLSGLFSHFVLSQPEELPDIQSLSFDTKAFYVKTEVEPIAEYIQQTVQKLVSSATPILFCGALDSFQNTIITMWGGLPVTFRKNFSFTAGFSLNNLDKSKTIIYFQKDLLGILKNQDFISDEKEQLIEISSEVEKYLLYPESNTDFESFLLGLGVNLNEWTLLAPCVKAYHSYLIVEQAIDPDELKLLIRNVAKISPDPTRGKDLKAKIISHLSSQISVGKETNIKSLRNIPVTEFENGQDLIGKAIESFIYQAFNNILPFSREMILELSSLITDLNSENWWNRVVIDAFKTEGESKKQEVLKNIWEVFTHSEKSTAEFIKFVPNKKERELQFIKCVPQSISKPIAESISKCIRERNWMLLHAHLIIKYKTIKLAIIEQVDMEEKQDSETFEGTTFLLSKINDEDLFSVILSKNSAVLVNAYGERSVDKPELLSKIDIDNPVWLQVWSVSLAATKDLRHGIIDLSGSTQKVIDLLLKGATIPDNLIALISQSEFADLTDYPKRKEVWKKIPSKSKSIFLEATAKGYIEKTTGKGLMKTEPEPELLNIITSDNFMEAFLSQQHHDMTPVLSIYAQIHGLSDNLLAKYISNYLGRINEIQSSQLGTLIMSNGFKKAANQVFEKAKRNMEFKIALTNCKSLINFGWWDIILFSHLLGETVSEKAVYSALLEITLSIYQLGPEEKDIWKRAGGDLSKLTNQKSREENWRHAIQMLQNGGGGKHISGRSLIKAMLEDFPNNNQIKEIQKHFR